LSRQNDLYRKKNSKIKNQKKKFNSSSFIPTKKILLRSAWMANQWLMYFWRVLLIFDFSRIKILLIAKTVTQ
jgi:hypothetical protein